MVVVGVSPLILVVARFIPIGLWITAYASGVRLSFVNLFGMRFRRVDPRSIVIPLISGHKAGLLLDVNELEAHYLAGGNVNRVVNALISADKAGIELDLQAGDRDRPRRPRRVRGGAGRA